MMYNVSVAPNRSQDMHSQSKNCCKKVNNNQNNNQALLLTLNISQSNSQEMDNTTSDSSKYNHKHCCTPHLCHVVIPAMKMADSTTSLWNGFRTNKISNLLLLAIQSHLYGPGLNNNPEITQI